MRVRTLGWAIGAVILSCSSLLQSCKPRTEESATSGSGEAPNQKSPASSDNSGGQPFSNWYLYDTAGENSGALPYPSSDFSNRATPPVYANLEESVFGTDLSGAPTWPSPYDPLSKVCMSPQGEAFEKIQPLFCVTVPQPNFTDIVDKAAAIRLGKALFWDVQAGGDGKTSCGSCHFAGGADSRTTNALHPGPNGVFESGGVTAAGQSFSPLKNITTDDRVGSQGVVGANFTKINANPAVAADDCTSDQVTPFFAHRRVTGRNTPSVIGAVFNKFNFWDGRANPAFNGFDPFGDTGNAANKTVLFTNGSLASQAVGPPNNSTEMSCNGRKFNGPGSLASKLLARRPLQFQQVSPTDSALGGLSNFPGNGLNCYGRACTYSIMIRDAFGMQWVPLAESNFSRLWGQALQAYMASLIPDQTRFDQYLAGKKSLMTPLQLKGFDVFAGTGRCVACHEGPELTDASVNYSRVAKHEDQGNDEGFHNLGLTATNDDLGRANVGPNGVSWAQSVSPFNRGAFKTPGLRNLKLTAPYFHNGGKATLEDVVAFYSHRGGDVPNSEMTQEIQEIVIDSAGDQTALVEFLRNGLLDCRVEKNRAPFDHPQIALPNGPTLSSTGMYGTGSCRLDPGVGPTTVNCIRNSGLCDTDKSLHGASAYKDFLSRLPTPTENGPFSAGNVTAMTTAIRTMLGSRENLNYELRRIVEGMVGRPLDISLRAFVQPSVAAMTRQVGSLDEYFARSGRDNTSFLKQLMQDLSDRQPSAQELRSGLTVIATDGRGAAVDYYFGLQSAKYKRINDLYRRFLRREATPAELQSAFAANNESATSVGIVLGAEYKSLAAARDDI